MSSIFISLSLSKNSSERQKDPNNQNTTMSRVLLKELLSLNTALNTTITTSSSSLSPTPSNDVTHSVWESPIPYLFGSLALMMILIGTALILLVFSYRKGYSDEKPSPVKPTAEESDRGEQIVVILAGDDRPTCIATPIVAISMPSTNVCSCGVSGAQHVAVKP